jgi:hypothetical protein
LESIQNKKLNNQTLTEPVLDETLNTLGQLGAVGTAIGTIALVFLFWRTIKQLEETVKLSRIQANYRFRPWVGPFGKIEFVKTTSDNLDQFSITMKNYGEIPASNVVAKFATRKELPTKELLKDSNLVSSFNLGPLLPNMEKRYWFFIDSDLIKSAKTGDATVYTLLYFSYDYHGGSNGYGLISHLDKESGNFVHNDMWID